MGSAAIAIATGGLLWFLLHHGPLGMQGHILALGALCALLAVGIQGAMGAPVLRKLSLGDSDGPRHRVARSQRIAAAFLMITVTCMAAARFA
jgi:hypothetical protein